jgi:hypothetical protein
MLLNIIAMKKININLKTPLPTSVETPGFGQSKQLLSLLQKQRLLEVVIKSKIDLKPHF